MRKSRRHLEQARVGFTLVEMLVVLAILGIIGAASVSFYIRESKVSLVRQTAIQIQADIENLRSSAIRFNRDATFDRVSNTVVKYTVPTSNTTSTPTSKTLASNVAFTLVSGADSFTYQAPLATIDADANVYKIEIADVPPVFIKTIGVTGKVILSATN